MRWARGSQRVAMSYQRNEAEGVDEPRNAMKARVVPARTGQEGVQDSYYPRTATAGTMSPW
jgi:hypothetical protein